MADRPDTLEGWSVNESPEGVINIRQPDGKLRASFFQKKTIAVFLAMEMEYTDRLEKENERLQAELDQWRPLTPEEAEKALEEAKAEPLSEEHIQSILAKALDPAYLPTNFEQMHLGAKVEALQEENERLRSVEETCIKIVDAIEPWLIEQAQAGRTGIKASEAVPLILAERDRLRAELAMARDALHEARNAIIGLGDHAKKTGVFFVWAMVTELVEQIDAALKGGTK